jgi:hypothetical protein
MQAPAGDVQDHPTGSDELVEPLPVVVQPIRIGVPLAVVLHGDLELRPCQIGMEDQSARHGDRVLSDRARYTAQHQPYPQVRLGRRLRPGIDQAEDIPCAPAPGRWAARAAMSASASNVVNPRPSRASMMPTAGTGSSQTAVSHAHRVGVVRGGVPLLCTGIEARSVVCTRRPCCDR